MARYKKERWVWKPITKRIRWNVFIVLIVITVAMVALIGRIVYLNANKGDEYKKEVLSQKSGVNKEIHYCRGKIVDRNNTILAQSTRKYDLILEPRTLKSGEEGLEARTISKIAEYFSVDSTKIQQAVDDYPNSMYKKVDELKKLSKEQVEGFKELMKETDDEGNKLIEGVWFEEVYVRNYPLKKIASNLVGFMSSESQGTYGVEESYNSELVGTNGREYGYFDSNLKYQKIVKEAENGNNVVMTIDANVQRIVENMIRKYYKNVGAKNIGILIMDPNNGEILAMASQNTYDLNNPRDLTAIHTQEEIDNMSEKEKKDAYMNMWRNFGIASAYEPGSTFKPFTVCAALDEGVVHDGDSYVCGGSLKVGEYDIHCAVRTGHGPLSLQESIMKSCNVALMHIGAKLGTKKFCEYNEIYGFGQITGIDLPGETAGQIFDEDAMKSVNLATSSFGQTQTVTMIQMAAGFSSLVNGGNYYQPHVVKEVQNENGVTVKSYDPVIVKKTISEKTSKLMRKYLKATVEEGTANPASVEGYSIGGKTGTAEKRETKDIKNDYLVSFLGCVPAMNPKAVVYVIIDEPNVADQAHSTYATEFASKVMKKVLPFLNIYPKTTKKDNKVENTTNDSDSSGQTETSDSSDQTVTSDSSDQTDDTEQTESSDSSDPTDDAQEPASTSLAGTGEGSGE